MNVLMLYVTANIFQSCREDSLVEPGSEVIKLPHSTQLSTKFTLLINAKMATTVGMLTIISVINTTSAILKTRNFFICWHFSS